MRPRAKIQRGQGQERKLAAAEARLKTFVERPGPEKASGEKAGEYRDRVKRHDFVMEKQVTRTEREIANTRARIAAKAVPPSAPPPPPERRESQRPGGPHPIDRRRRP